jgi:hypothetical protein
VVINTKTHLGLDCTYTKEKRLLQRHHGKLALDMDMDKEGDKADMDMDKEGAALKNVRGSKFLDKGSTKVGEASSTCLIAFDMCIFMCVLALHKFLNLVCMLVWCMLAVEFG